MTALKTIDLKGLSSEEREQRLFGALDELGTGQSVQVTLEFNPLPLVYTLKFGGEFHIAYLQEGPEEWSLELTRTAQPAEKREQLKELVRMLKQELIREGITQGEIRSHLCDIHLEVLRDSLAARRIEVASPHPVHTLMDEHRVILDNLDTLGSLVERLRGQDSFAGAREEVALLPEVTRILLAAESHHQRAEEVIFLHLEKHGIQEPQAIMKADHVELRGRKVRLALLAEAARQSSDSVFVDWRREVVELGEYLNRELASHILKEDNILYQMALQVFDREEWEQVKQECDAIGYCRFAAEGQPEPRAVELDMRSVPLLQRQARIMSAWRQLPAGGVLRLTNDREPKPLYYLFQATQRGHFEWSYEQEGPEEWIAAIRKR
jgi:hypothetical protein